MVRVVVHHTTSIIISSSHHLNTRIIMDSKLLLSTMLGAILLSEICSAVSYNLKIIIKQKKSQPRLHDLIFLYLL